MELANRVHKHPRPIAAKISTESTEDLLRIEAMHMKVRGDHQVLELTRVITRTICRIHHISKFSSRDLIAEG